MREAVAAILGYDRAADVDPDQSFADLGFNSLAAMELSRRLGEATGLELSLTLGFDHPTPAALGRYLAARLAGDETESASEISRTAVPDRPGDPDDSGEDPIAIVGMSCRYPGGVRSPDELWEAVATGRDAISEFPGDRGWDVERIYDPEPDHPGTCYTRSGGFVGDATDFDAGFFGISDREALAMDPQQRLLLEGAWKAFEHAGIDPAELRDTPTGVFVGVATHDYYGALANAVPDDLEGYFGIGNAGSVASGRLAHQFGLQGPAITVDTACSSSLVALHLACAAVRRGECSSALAGGVTVLATPGMFVDFSRHRGLSPDGRCRSFAAGANGTGWSEGVGLVLVERLSRARRLGHPVLALIRGSAVNQDGASNGLSAPSGPAQERVIRAALAAAGVGAHDVDAVEAHGTATTLGDPIEIQALLATYCAGRSPERPLWLGSLKSNLGHCQAAAGVGGIVKMVMALRHGELPRTLHAEEPTPKADWSAGTLRLLTDGLPWPAADGPRLAGVSAFGISGTNCHVVLEQAPADSAGELPVEGEDAASPAPVPWILSARSEQALRAQAARLREHVAARPQLDRRAVARSLAQGRTRMAHRAVAVAVDRDALLAAVDAIARDEPAAGVVGGLAVPGAKVAFLFTGQGSQRHGMGRRLARAFPLFAEALDAACEALDPFLERPLRSVMWAGPRSRDADLLHQTAYTQPALFALEVALFRLVRSLGVQPDRLLGHSIGELAAAHASGVLSLADASALVAARGRLMQSLPAGGAMLAVQAPEEAVQPTLEGLEDQLVVAAVNGPTSVVVSGDEPALAEWAAQWDDRGVRTTRLRVSHAFHSPRMDPMLAEFERTARGLRFSAPEVPIVSNVTGTLATAQELCSPEYWVRQVRSPVRYLDGMRRLQADGVHSFLELGPAAVLCGLGRACLADGAAGQPPVLAATLKDGQPDEESFLAALAELHVHGVDVDWGALPALRGAPRVDLPTYAFQRRRYWALPARRPGDVGDAGLQAARHPLLGASLTLAGSDERVLTGRVSAHEHPWLLDHVVAGVPLISGTTLVDLALLARSDGCDVLEELTIEAPLVLPQDGSLDLQLRVGEQDGDGRRSLSIAAREPGGDWARHASGVLGGGADAPAGVGSPAGAWPPAGAAPLAVEELYDGLAELGFDYGPAFRCVRAAWRRGDEIFAVVAEPGGGEDDAGFVLHPGMLDAAFHPLVLAEGTQGAPRLPFAWSGVRVAAAGAGAGPWRVRVSPAGDGAARLDVTGEDDAPIASVDAVMARPLPAGGLGAPGHRLRDALFRLEWVAVAAQGTRGPEPPTLEQARDAVSSGAPAPAAVLERLPTGATGPAASERVRAACHDALALVQEWLADERFADSRLVIVTEGAMAARPDDRPDPAGAALWGLVRSAQTEHPGRFLLVDAEAGAATGALAQALNADEPQLARRDGRLLAPRLVAVAGAPGAAADWGRGSVLITGGTAGLGALVARHLVAAHGVRDLVLASRRGLEAEGAAALAEALREHGASVDVVACDVSDRAQVEKLVDACGELSAVVHCAGVIDDGVVEAQTPQRLDRALGPKADAALHLDELTRGHDLAAFVLFSSVAGTAGTGGQANYAAANSCIDAVAQRRHRDGLPAVSIAWGLWAAESEMTAGLGAPDRDRLGVPLAPDEGLALLDAAVALDDAVLIATRLDRRMLRALARESGVPQLLRGLVPAGATPAPSAPASLEHRLAALPAAERAGAVVDVVAAAVAAVLGESAPDAIDLERSFNEIGFDSLKAVELRNRLGAETGLRLAPTIVFDEPTPAAVVAYLLERLSVAEDGAAPAADTELDRIEAALTSLADSGAAGLVAARLRALLNRIELGADRGEPELAERLRTASTDELLDFLDRDLGVKSG